MIVIILFVVMFILAIGERILYSVFQHREFVVNNIKRIIIYNRIIATVIIFVIAYFVTDTVKGVMLVGFSLVFYVILFLSSRLLKDSLISNLIFLIAIPLLLLLLMSANDEMLVYANDIFFPIMVISWFLNTNLFSSISKQRNITLIVGLIIGFVLLFITEKDMEKPHRYKQEIIAEEFLENKLNINASEVELDRDDTKLRGEEVEVRAYKYSENIKITMIYKNNWIVSYKIDR